MTWSAAFPGAVVRLLRTAVGRRAFQVGLLVGGLFVLGFLCGEQAHAADGVGVLPGKAAIGQLVKPPAEPRVMQTDTDPDTDPATDSAREPVDGVLTRPAEDKVLRPVVEDVVGTVGDRVVQPVGDLVETVTTGLTETVGIPPLTELPELPTFPESPSWPTLPTVPGLPEVPVRTLPAPVISTPQPQPHPESGGDAAATKPADDEGSSGGDDVYGPRFAGRAVVIEAVADASVHHGTSTVHAPVHQAPADNPGGALGGRSAVDNGSSRHGDAHALTPHHRAPLRLVPGAAAGVDAAGTRDRHRDIPVFPG